MVFERVSDRVSSSKKKVPLVIKIDGWHLTHLDSSIVLVAPIEARLVKCYVLGPCLGPIFVVLATHDVMAGIRYRGSQHLSPYAVLQATVDIVCSDEMMAMGMRSHLSIVWVAKREYKYCICKKSWMSSEDRRKQVLSAECRTC